MDSKWDFESKRDDGRAITPAEDDSLLYIDDTADSKSLPSPSKYKGIGLDLSFADSGKYDEMECENDIQESNVLVNEKWNSKIQTIYRIKCHNQVIFDLPDGSQGEGQFKLGHTVEFMKSFVECEYGIPMQDQEFFLEEKRMINPLSLMDFAEAKGVDEIFIRVEGDMPNDCKK